VITLEKKGDFGGVVYRLSTSCLPVDYRLTTGCLPVVYRLSAGSLPLGYRKSTHSTQKSKNPNTDRQTILATNISQTAKYWFSL